MFGNMQKGYTVYFCAVYSGQLKTCSTRAVCPETTASNQHSARPEVMFISTVSQDNPDAYSQPTSPLPFKSVSLENGPLYLLC